MTRPRSTTRLCFTTKLRIRRHYPLSAKHGSNCIQRKVNPQIRLIESIVSQYRYFLIIELYNCLNLVKNRRIKKNKNVFCAYSGLIVSQSVIRDKNEECTANGAYDVKEVKVQVVMSVKYIYEF